MATVQWTHSIRLRKHLRNRHGTMFHRTCNVLRAYGVRLRKHLSNRYCTVFNWGIARQGGVNARALARRADGIDSVIVVVANLQQTIRGFCNWPFTRNRHGTMLHWTCNVFRAYGGNHGSKPQLWRVPFHKGNPTEAISQSDAQRLFAPTAFPKKALIQS